MQEEHKAYLARQRNRKEREERRKFYEIRKKEREEKRKQREKKNSEKKDDEKSDAEPKQNDTPNKDPEPKEKTFTEEFPLLGAEIKVCTFFSNIFGKCDFSLLASLRLKSFFFFH